MPRSKRRKARTIPVFPRQVQLPRIGRMRTSERTDKLLRLLEQGKARVLSATIARKAGRWSVVLTCEVQRELPLPPGRDAPVVGLGLSTYATLRACCACRSSTAGAATSWRTSCTGPPLALRKPSGSTWWRT